MNGIYAIKPKFQSFLKPAETFLISCRIHPDWITLAALLLSIAGAFLFLFSSKEGMLFLLCSTPFVSLGRTVLNALDGMVAKGAGLARPWGEVLNEFSDRLADLSLFLGLALSQLCSGPLMIAALISVLFSSYLGVLSKAAGGQRQYGGIMGKADRMILLAIAGPLAFGLAKSGVCSCPVVFDCFAFIVLGGSLLTIVERAIKTYADLKSI